MSKVKDWVGTAAKNKWTEQETKAEGENTILITKETFDKYREVQYGGAYNMMFEWAEACDAAGMTTRSYWSIIKNYGELEKHYGEYNPNE